MAERTGVARYLRTRVSASEIHRQLGPIIILSIMVASVVCLCFSSWYASKQKELEDSEVKDKDDKKRKIIRSLLQAKHVVMVITAADLTFRCEKSSRKANIRAEVNELAQIEQCPSSSNVTASQKEIHSSPREKDEDCVAVLNLPCVDTTKTSLRSVSANCIICLEDFKTGDTVAWSHNSQCVHCFHLDCFVEASITKIPTKNKLPCPVCRQWFLSDVELTQSSCSND